jgi:hypothetical protein
MALINHNTSCQRGSAGVPKVGRYFAVGALCKLSGSPYRRTDLNFLMLPHVDGLQTYEGALG